MKYIFLIVFISLMACNNAGESAEGRTTPATDSGHVPMSVAPSLGGNKVNNSTTRVDSTYIKQENQ